MKRRPQNVGEARKNIHLPCSISTVSALTGQGLPQLIQEIEMRLMQATGRSYMDVCIPAQGNHLKWLHENVTVHHVSGQGDDHFNVQVIATKAQLARFLRTFPDAEVLS